MENIINGVYKHYKGGEVLVVSVTKHSETKEDLVVYVGLQDFLYHVRPLNSFLDLVNVEGKQVPRFTFVKEVYIDNSSLIDGVYKILN